MEKKTQSLTGRLFWIVLAVVIATAIVRIYYRATDDFRLNNIVYDLSYHQEWEIQPLSSAEETHLNAILNQKFSYIGKGAQCYAFASDDQQYVIKFFKFKHLKPSIFTDLLPSIPPFQHYKERQVRKKERKLNSIFAGYKLAYEKDKTESGLIFIHLNPTDTVHKTIIVRDKIGLERVIDLDQVVFIVQEKAQTLRNVLADLLDKGDLTAAKSRIGQIFDLYLSEYQKGVYDRDHGVMHNTGFVGDRPIHLDVGKLSQDDNIRNPETAQKDFALVIDRMETWLRSSYPEDFPVLHEYIVQKQKDFFAKAYSLKDAP